MADKLAEGNAVTGVGAIDCLTLDVHSSTTYHFDMDGGESEAKNSGVPGFRERVRHYAEELNPLFDCAPHMASHRFFEFVCVLTRAGGVHGPDWDPWHESQATLDDLGNLATLDLPKELFPKPETTRVRLSLLSYCHLTEMDFPYSLIANLLRIRLGQKYDMMPFRDLYQPYRGKKNLPFQKVRPPSPRKKTERIKELAGRADLAPVGQALESILDSPIRNAVYHSDYAISDGELRLRNEFRFSRKRGYGSQVVEWAELEELFRDTFAFHTALFSLYDRCLKSFGDFDGAVIPYDGHYKGLLQLLFDAGARLCGFRVYWPNGTLGEYRRIGSASSGVNLSFDPDGSINFMVGLYASRPGKFSPLVESAEEPVYPQVPGTSVRPYWPADVKVYKLDAGTLKTPMPDSP